MQLQFFNDTRRLIRIHPATELHGVKTYQTEIHALGTGVFEVPDGCVPWLKMWDYGDYGLSLLVSTAEPFTDLGLGRDK